MTDWQCHLLSRPGQLKNKWEWRNLHRWQKFYTAASSDGRDESHLWMTSQSFRWRWTLRSCFLHLSYGRLQTSSGIFPLYKSCYIFFFFKFTACIWQSKLASVNHPGLWTVYKNQLIRYCSGICNEICINFKVKC